MSEPEGAPPKRDDETSPFPLERGRIESETTGERTGPFLLEREKPISDAPPPPEPASSEAPIPDARAPVVALTQSARHARRRIAITLLVHATRLAVLCTLSIVRWTKGIATPRLRSTWATRTGTRLGSSTATSKHTRGASGDEARDFGRLALVLA